MAQDGIDLLDHLEIQRAHVAGVSMGGMIAQTMAARHPERVFSLASIMSNTGHLWRGMPGLRAYPIFLRRPASDLAARDRLVVATFTPIGSPGFPFDEDELRESRCAPTSAATTPPARAASSPRSSPPATGPRVATITAPTLVVHGTRDVHGHAVGREATARAIKGSRLVPDRRMGHDLPARPLGPADRPSSRRTPPAPPAAARGVLA